MAKTITEMSAGARSDTWLSPDRFALILWLGFLLTSLFLHRGAIAGLSFSDPDNGLRLAQVRDLLGGQGWFDTTQYRTDPAGGGGATHWSRFVDAPIAALIALLGEFIDHRPPKHGCLRFIHHYWRCRCCSSFRESFRYWATGNSPSSGW